MHPEKRSHPESEPSGACAYRKRRWPIGVIKQGYGAMGWGADRAAWCCCCVQATLQAALNESMAADTSRLTQEVAGLRAAHEASLKEVQQVSPHARLGTQPPLPPSLQPAPSCNLSNGRTCHGLLPVLTIERFDSIAMRCHKWS
jgi:hypothetical protein